MPDAKALHPSRSARNHLLAFGQEQPDQSVACGRRTRHGRSHRCGFTTSRHVRPRYETVAGNCRCTARRPTDPDVRRAGNGLDPEGILWIRNLLCSLAMEGRTIFLSSHPMSEMAQTADQSIVVGRGRLIIADSVANVLGGGLGRVRMETPQFRELATVLDATEPWSTMTTEYLRSADSTHDGSVSLRSNIAS